MRKEEEAAAAAADAEAVANAETEAAAAVDRDDHEPGGIRRMVQSRKGNGARVEENTVCMMAIVGVSTGGYRLHDDDCRCGHGRCRMSGVCESCGSVGYVRIFRWRVEDAEARAVRVGCGTVLLALAPGKEEILRRTTVLVISTTVQAYHPLQDGEVSTKSRTHTQKQLTAADRPTVFPVNVGSISCT